MRPPTGRRAGALVAAGRPVAPDVAELVGLARSARPRSASALRMPSSPERRSAALLEPARAARACTCRSAIVIPSDRLRGTGRRGPPWPRAVERAEKPHESRPQSLRAPPPRRRAARAARGPPRAGRRRRRRAARRSRRARSRAAGTRRSGTGAGRRRRRQAVAGLGAPGGGEQADLVVAVSVRTVRPVAAATSPMRRMAPTATASRS